MPCYGLYSGKIFWDSRYYRGVCSRNYTLFHKGFRVHSKQDGHQFLHIVRASIFCQYWIETNLDSLNASILIFSIAFVAVGLVSKIVGCGIMAKICKFNMSDSLKIGVGMMTRGEVALIVSQKGLSVGLLTPVYFTSVILLIIISSIATPIILKLLYAKDERKIKAA